MNRAEVTDKCRAALPDEFKKQHSVQKFCVCCRFEGWHRCARCRCHNGRMAWHMGAIPGIITLNLDKMSEKRILQ